MADWLLETERLQMRPIQPGDAELQHRHLNSAATMECLGGTQPLEAIEQKHARAMEMFAREGAGWLMMFERESGELVGHCGLKRVDHPHAKNIGDFECGWLVREDRWRLGYAREAIDAVLEWAFLTFDAPHVVALTSQRNEASWRFMERLGMQRRQDLDFHDPDYPPHDNPTILYSLDRTAWDAQRA